MFVIMSVAWQKLPLYYEGKLTTNYPVVQAIYLFIYLFIYLYTVKNSSGLLFL